MVKSNLMIPFILRNVNVRLFRRYCSVLSDEGVQFETARVFNSIAVFKYKGVKLKCEYEEYEKEVLSCISYFRLIKAYLIMIYLRLLMNAQIIFY